MFHFNFHGELCELKAGILELADDFDYAASFDACCEACDCVQVSVIAKDGDKLSVRYAKGEAEIVYGRKHHFFRALGLLIEHLRDGETEFSVEETAYFTMNGPMYDVSQGNAVININASKNILRRMAIMGLNMIMMYCEDSFDVPNQPYFGYMRARYSEEDMRTLDAYADMFGIEMIPCIQTLAHLVDALKWSAFSDIKEDNECLLVGEEKTYAFIRDLLVAASRPFRTKRIHIGMDEAWHLGRGRYQDLHGIVPKTEIMLEHLNRVMEIVRELGLKPMMWSDMFFRAASGGKYHDTSVHFGEDVKKLVPDDIQLVYWDYYHDDVEDFYRTFIDTHRELGEPIFAGGIWTWAGFAAHYKKTIRTTNPALMTCKKKGVKEVFATVWGDNGTECSVYATLLGLSLYAEHNYTYEVSEEQLKRRFEFCCGTKFEDFMNLTYLDETPGAPDDQHAPTNPSKVLMWQDILGGLVDKNFAGYDLNDHYAKLAETFKPAMERNGDYNEFFKFNYHVANVLAMKAEMGMNLTKVYKSGDKAELKKYADELLPELRERVAALRQVHMDHWFNIYKAFGWDIMDMRYGSLLARIDSAITVIQRYLDGKLPTIEELDEERLLYNGQEGFLRLNHYNKFVSASRIAPKA